jgi:mannose-6-phosphate isomerase-like protein (cupin superfamily)
MDAWRLEDLADQQQRSGRLYLEFLKVPSLSCGLYVLPAGSADPQRPHREDEVYYVISGRAQVRVADEDRPVGPGSVVFVKAEVDHRFHEIEETLSLLVFFAPPKTTPAG